MPAPIKLTVFIFPCLYFGQMSALLGMSQVETSSL